MKKKYAFSFMYLLPAFKPYVDISRRKQSYVRPGLTELNSPDRMFHSFKPIRRLRFLKYWWILRFRSKHFYNSICSSDLLSQPSTAWLVTGGPNIGLGFSMCSVLRFFSHLPNLGLRRWNYRVTLTNSLAHPAQVQYLEGVIDTK